MIRFSAVFVVLCLASSAFAWAKENRYHYHHSHQDEPEDTLILSHVLFRHGDRTPDVSTIYPTDPYMNETFFPYGKGQLTLQGKQRAFALGKSLRQRYNEFLGNLYTPDIIEARSSAYPRTQMTLQLALTGLFPPTKEYRIAGGLNWQPIPYLYTDYEQDKLVATFRSCERIFDIVDDMEKTLYRNDLTQYNDLFAYLSEHSGWQVNNTRFTFFIQNTLKVESEWGFELPEWTKKIWNTPEFTSASELFWKYMSGTKELNRINIGNLLQKIVTDTQNKIDGKNSRKIYLYSGHDFTVVPMLAAFGNFDGKMAPYTSHVIIELHKINGIYGIKLFFQNYEQRLPKQLTIPGCDSFCPFDEFVKIAEDYYPGEKWC
ncbi:PREDICTED: venom acid phosphatase Acph-1-like [Nicrophorus vespilloides]|uniref:acid phosphatase n=1 Tax=Nicrophorus vespilloides TaxID=110193 RepID=A0ABM1N1K6_NICVS|nr:PREDICTED: venom acid phosphatase Acph-1-like [Nicrophorus vespilloides]